MSKAGATTLPSVYVFQLVTDLLQAIYVFGDVIMCVKNLEKYRGRYFLSLSIWFASLYAFI